MAWQGRMTCAAQHGAAKNAVSTVNIKPMVRNTKLELALAVHQVNSGAAKPVGRVERDGDLNRPRELVIMSDCKHHSASQKAWVSVFFKGCRTWYLVSVK